MDILAVVILTSTIQSLFGVGVLLFGTPLLLLLGYSFFDILLILLPISASINVLQIAKNHKEINFKIYKYILFITVPFIIIFLLLASISKIDLNAIIGVFLLFIAIKDLSPYLKNLFEKILSYNKIFYSFMGIVHGMTNLGGALLTAKIFHTNLNKYEKRATIALSYLTFASFQIVTLSFLDIHYPLSNIFFLVAGILVYLIVNKITFQILSNKQYDQIFSIFLIIAGVSLILKGIIW